MVKKKEMLFSISLRDTTKFPRDLLQVKHGKMFTKTSDAYVQIEIIQVHQKQHYRMYQIQNKKNQLLNPLLKRKVNISDTIRDYFTGPKARLLFYFRKDESAYDCLTKRIDDNKLNGLYPQMIVRWNVIHRVDEKFPHPNYYIELGKVYVPLFLESFPEAKIKLRKWANRHLEIISCEAVAIEMRRNIIPKILTHGAFLHMKIIHLMIPSQIVLV